jgi:L,D-peptidoglycan transpeptidase YkuD (ErfK/YbiS/YcfS/YnhG family)
VVIRHAAFNAHRAVAQVGHLSLNCSIGPAGIRTLKREGDGATPAGVWPLRHVLYRPDRMLRPRTALPVHAISPDDGWCDDPRSAQYNKPVRLPCRFSHERLWRDDHLYDLILVMGHNDDPPVRGRGSAVFIHLRAADGGPTQGCIAFAKRDLLYLLSLVDQHTTVLI